MKNTPRDFFLHFGAFVFLYSAAIALATLLFRMIDYAFPDPLYATQYGYSDPYSGPMRFAIASLIILVPIFLWLMRIMQREARVAPERYSLTIRRWLTYITLFIAGVTMVGDLIALLNSFLGGELATTFLLKVVVLFAIVGVVFWYFLLDIRGYWREQEQKSKMVGWGVLALVGIIIVGGFVIMGSPLAQREIRFDQQEIQDLSTTQNEIVNYWQQNGRLPANVSDLESDITGFHVRSAPNGRDAYEYKPMDDHTFSLCATFAQNSEKTSIEPYAPYGIGGNISWKHTSGHTCFTRNIDTDLIQPHTKPMM